MAWQPPEEYFDDVEKPGWKPPEEYFDDSPVKIKDTGTIQQMKASGQPLTREQERILWEADEAKPLTQKASEAVTTFFPTALNIAKQLGTGAGEFLYKGVLKPIDTMSQSPEEAEKTLKEAGNVWRSAVHGVAQDIQETADAGVRFSMFSSSITDKLLGKSDGERFERYILRNANREFAQKVYEDNPDAAARLMAENPMLQGLAYAAAIAQGGTEEEAQMAKQAYEQLVKESGLTKDEINENIALLGEVISPLSLPGTNTATRFLNKGTSKVVQKTGELALRGIAPIAKGVEKTAGGVEKLVDGAEKLSRKIGEYTVGDPDTLIKTTTTTALAPAKIPAKMTRGIARTIADVASEAGGIGGTAGRRGIFERAGRSATAGDLTKKLFGPEALGRKGRARVADWAVRQANAIAQPAVNGAVLNVALGLPDIETGTDLGFMAGVGAGIGAYGGARLPERTFALVDPTTSLAQKIDAVLTPDPEGLRRDQDADIKRFLATADTSLLDSINDLSNLDNIKSALDVKIKNLEGRKTAQIRDEDAKRIQAEIDNLKNQRKALDKSTPQTEAEIKRQIQLSFADAMDLAKTTGAAAGLNNIQVKVLRPDQMEQFYRDLYGKTLTDAESVVSQLLGNPRMTAQEKEMFDKADQTVKAFLADVAGASTARGFAISESSTRPEHLRYENQKGATVVINGDLVTQIGRDGLNLARVINHEIQHGLSNFEEVRQMLAPLRRQLFDQKIQNPDGTFEVVSKGSISDAQLDAYALQYAAAMDASGGASFLGQFANQDQLRAYMKEEVLSELAGLSGASHGDLRGSLDSAGRQVVDWLEVKSQNGALKKIKEGLRRFGIVVDDQGQFSSVLGAELTPEALAAMRQYQRKLRDLNESMVYNSDPRKDAPEITLTQIATNSVLQERYKHSEFFEQQQVVVLTTPDGRTQEVVVPPGAKVDKFIGDYQFQGGRLVDADGNPVSLGPDIPIFQTAMPDGTAVTVDTRIARNVDGSPRILSPREIKRRAKKRTEEIRKAIDDAPDDQSGVRLEDMGNGNYRGTLSPAQLDAINALPNDLVAPSLKRKIAFFNDILGRKDGTIAEIEYQAALRDGKYRAIQPQIRTEIPIGFQFSKDGNFLMTTMSVSRMHDKANAWAAKRPKNLRLWGGDMTKFWDSVRQYLINHKGGLQGHIGLHPDPEIAMQMKNRINDLFNVYRKETREANPERTTLPKRRGQDPIDVVIRARRMDRINSYDETALPKMPFQYELAVQNYLPAENPLAEFQSAEQFAQATDSEPELVQRAIGGEIEPLELQLHEQDVLHPAEYLDVQEGQIRVRSMFDPTQNVFVPGESESDTPALISRAKRLSSELDEMYVAGATDPRINEYESDLEKTYQQLESQAQEQESETYDFAESPETSEVNTMNSPVEAMISAIDAYNSGRVDNESQTLAQYIRSSVGSSGALQIPENVTDRQIDAAANDIVQYRQSLKDRIRSGTAFSNTIVAPAGIQYLPAFHGSPYDFDKFQIDRIGSGEGAQAYGWGLYFAGLRDVGEGYRKKLAREIRIDGIPSPKEEDISDNQNVADLLGVLTDALKLKQSGTMPDRKNIDRAIRMLEDEKEAAIDNTYAEEVLNWWFNAGIKGLKDPSKIQTGTLYKVELDVDDSNLLDWDKPLSEQSKIIQEAVIPKIVSEFQKIKEAREAIIQRGTRLGGRPFRPGELEQLQKPMPDPLSITGKAAYVYVTNSFGGRPAEDSPKASNFLLSQGVNGIRYFDAFSRGAGEGTHNYVVFDDKLITVLEKNDKPVGPVTQFMPAESEGAMPVAKVLDVYERAKDPNLVRLGMDIDLFPGKREARVQVEFNNLEDVDKALSLSDNEDAISLPEWISATIESKIPGFKSSGWGYLSPEDIIDNKAMISVGEDVPVPENIIPFSPDIRFMPPEQSPEGMEGVEPPKLYPRATEIIRPLQGVEPPVAVTQAQGGEMAVLRQTLQGVEAPGATIIPDIPQETGEAVVEKPKEIPPEQSAFISEKALRKFDAFGDKNARQVDADNMKYPVNPNPDSVALPGRWGVVNAKITGMPKTFKEVSEIIDRQVNRLVRLVNANPEFARESARFYRDMAESATMITDAAFPQAKGKEKYLFDELVLRFLALGSPRTAVASNATKSAGSISALIDEFEAGYKIGFGEQSHGAKTTYNAWKDGGHFDLSLPGVQDKVRTFYLNSLSELIEIAEAKNDTESVEELMLRAGKSMRVLDPDRTSKLSDVEKKEIQRLLDGKATIDMWDMAAKGWAWPGFLIFKNRRNSVKKPFQWSQDDFEKIGTFADKSWRQVLSELKVTSPEQLRYQQARALKVDGNPDWTLETWNERKTQPFPDSTKFSYYTQGTEAGLSPGGGGPLYDAQQAIDGLLADRLNELGLAPLFGKTKLKARNAQEILWALEKLDNPDEANNDLSLFGSTFEPFLNEVLKLRLGKDIDKKSRAENVLAAMDRAYATMAEQLIPIEVVSSGTSEEAKRIQDAIENLKTAGDPTPEKTITLHIADGLGKVVNDLAIKHGIKTTIENVEIGDGGYTEKGNVAVAPNIRITLRGNPSATFLLLETLSRAMDQDGGNVIRKPTMRELNDSRVQKNLILTIPTTGLNLAQRNKMFLDLSALKDANGKSFLTGFTEVEGGIAIGNQFYSGNYKKAIIDNKTNIDGILKNYGLSLNQSAPVTSAIIQKFERGQASTKIEPLKIKVKNKEVVQPSFASDLYDYIKDRMTNLPLAGSSPAFAQKTDFANNWIDKADALFARLESYPVKTKPQKEKAKLEAPDISSNTKRTTALVDLKAELESGVLRELVSEDVANKLKARYGFKKEKPQEEEE